MKNGLSPMGKRVKGYFSREMAEISITVVIFVVTVLTSGLIYFRENYGMGYKYYDLNTEIGIVQQNNFLENTITDYLKQLEGDGYIVVFNELKLNIKEKKTIINKKENDEQQIKNLILDNLDVTVELTKVTIKDENAYYFKTKEKAVEFINTLNEFIEQEYTIEESLGKITDITTEEVLNLKIDKIKEEKNLKDKKAKEAAEAAKKRAQASTTVSRGGSSKRYNAPMASYVLVSSPYGWRSSGWHNGVDFAAPQGTELYAWKDGIVTFAAWSGNYGYLIIIDHGDGTVSKYAHCSKIISQVGDTVVKNQTIGLVGSTGRSTGPHLHFEIKINGKNVDPLLYL